MQEIYTLINTFRNQYKKMLMKNYLIKKNADFARLKSIATIIFSSMLFLFLFGCDEDDDDSRVETLVIASKLVLTGTNPQTEILVEVMECVIENSTKKFNISQGDIIGFEYEEGYEYRIKVLITPIKNPPMDGPVESFTLIEVLSKEKVE